MHISAEEFAKDAHLGQMYGKVPYWHHLQSVVNVLGDFGYIGRWADAGWVHDTPEEPGVSEDTIQQLFGVWVREIVHACYGVGKTRLYRNADMYNRLQHRLEAAPLKVADRISHLEAAVPGSSHAQMYLKERLDFRMHVANYGPSLMHHRLELNYDRLVRMERQFRVREKSQ